MLGRKHEPAERCDGCRDDHAASDQNDGERTEPSPAPSALHGGRALPEVSFDLPVETAGGSEEPQNEDDGQHSGKRSAHLPNQQADLKQRVTERDPSAVHHHDFDRSRRPIA